MKKFRIVLGVLVVLCVFCFFYVIFFSGWGLDPEDDNQDYDSELTQKEDDIFERFADENKESLTDVPKEGRGEYSRIKIKKDRIVKYDEIEIHPFEKYIVEKYQKYGRSGSIARRIVTAQGNQFNGVANSLLCFYGQLITSIFSDFVLHVNFPINKNLPQHFFNYIIPSNPYLLKEMKLVEGDIPNEVKDICRPTWIEREDSANLMARKWGHCGQACEAVRSSIKPGVSTVNANTVFSLDPPKDEFCIAACTTDPIASHITCNREIMRVLCEDLQLCGGLEDYLEYHLKRECGKINDVFGFQQMAWKLYGNMFKALRFRVHPRLEERYNDFLSKVEGVFVGVQIRTSWMKEAPPDAPGDRMHRTADWSYFIECFQNIYRETIKRNHPGEKVTLFLTGENIFPDDVVKKFRDTDPENIKILTKEDYSSEGFFERMKGKNLQFEKSETSDAEEIGISIAFDFLTLGKVDYAISTFQSSWGATSISPSDAFPPWVQFRPLDTMKHMPSMCKRSRLFIVSPENMSKDFHDHSSWVYDFDSLVYNGPSEWEIAQ